MHSCLLGSSKKESNEENRWTLRLWPGIAWTERWTSIELEGFINNHPQVDRLTLWFHLLAVRTKMECLKRSVLHLTLSKWNVCELFYMWLWIPLVIAHCDTERFCPDQATRFVSHQEVGRWNSKFHSGEGFFAFNTFTWFSFLLQIILYVNCICWLTCVSEHSGYPSVHYKCIYIYHLSQDILQRGMLSALQHRCRVPFHNTSCMCPMSYLGIMC